MKIDENNLSYLSGNSFSNGIHFTLAERETRISSRKEIIKKVIKGKKVIHLGCCDHVPLIDKKIKDGSWMHKIITENSDKCLGIDIEPESIKYVKNIGFDNVIWGDITAENKIQQISTEEWDFMILGEILEHTDNPTLFLKKIRDNYIKSIDKLLITVPNAFYINNFKNVKMHMEFLNSDHRYWFTPYSLAKIGTIAGYKVEDFYFTQDISEKIGLRAKIKVIPYLKRKYLIRNLKKYPGFRTTLAMIMSL